MLLADFSQPATLPTRTGSHGGDDPKVRARVGQLNEPAVRKVADSLNALRTLGLLQRATVQSRRHGSAPLLTMYLLNNRDLFLGLCKVRERRLTIDKKQVKIQEPASDAVTLVHYTANEDPDSTGSHQVHEAGEWLENVWRTMGRVHQPS